MKTFSSIFMMLHVAAGFTSLLLFWIPAFTKKGGINHVKVGKLYMWLMWIVVISAAILSIKNLYIGRIEMAAFLGFLTFITANPLWKGIAILNHKKGLSKTFQQTHLIFEILIFIAGALLLGYGIYLQGRGAGILMIIFGLIGVSNLKPVIKMIKNPPEKMDWFMEHVKDMITTGIAAYTAFFAFGGRTYLGEIFTGYWMIVPWVAPTFIGVFAMKYLEKYYTKKKGKKTVVVPAI